MIPAESTGCVMSSPLVARSVDAFPRRRGGGPSEKRLCFGAHSAPPVGIHVRFNAPGAPKAQHHAPLPADSHHDPHSAVIQVRPTVARCDVRRKSEARSFITKQLEDCRNALEITTTAQRAKRSETKQKPGGS